jgi:hypothetical protein
MINIILPIATNPWGLFLKRKDTMTELGLG